MGYNSLSASLEYGLGANLIINHHQSLLFVFSEFFRELYFYAGLICMKTYYKIMDEENLVLPGGGHFVQDNQAGC